MWLNSHGAQLLRDGLDSWYHYLQKHLEPEPVFVEKLS